MTLVRMRARAIAQVALPVILIAGGAFLRFHRIGAKSLWLDEAVTLNAIGGRFSETAKKTVGGPLDEAATQGGGGRLAEIVPHIIAYDAHPPLYYGLLHLWMGGSDSAARARAFSAVVGVATLAVFYALARVLLPRAAAAVATLLLALSAFHVYFAQEARNYALVTFFVTLSWYFLVQLVAGKWQDGWGLWAGLALPNVGALLALYYVLVSWVPNAPEVQVYGLLGLLGALAAYVLIPFLLRDRLERWPLWLALALTNALALYTFYYAVFAIAAQLVVLLLLLGLGRIQRGLLLRWLSWQLIPLALFAFYTPVILEWMGRLAGKAPPAGHTVLTGTGLTETASQFAWGFMAQLVSPDPALGEPMANLAAQLVAILVLAAALLGLRTYRCATVAVLGWLLVPVILLGLLPVQGHTYEPKHLLFASPAFALLLGLGLAGARSKLLRALVALLAAALAIENAGSLRLYYDRSLEKEDWHSAVTALAHRADHTDVVYLNPLWTYFPFRYYYVPQRCGPKCEVVSLEQLAREAGVADLNPAWTCFPFRCYHVVLAWRTECKVVLLRGTPLVGRALNPDDLKQRRRIWVVESISNVEIPNPALVPALQHRYECLYQESYPGLVGHIRILLFDTAKPRPPLP